MRSSTAPHMTKALRQTVEPPVAAFVAERVGRSDNRSPSRVRSSLKLPYTAAIVYLGLNLLGFVAFTYPVGAQGMGTGSPIYQVCLLFSFGLTVLAVRPWEDPRRLFLPLSMVVLLAWCWLSTSWAITFDNSLRRVVQATVIALAGFYIVRSLGYQRLVDLFRWSFAIQLFLCYAAVILIPDIGIRSALVLSADGPSATWAGIMLDKNTAGAFCAIMVLVFLFDAKTIKPWARFAAIAAALFFLMNSASKTSIGILILAVAFGGMVRAFNPRYRSYLLPLSMVALVVLFFVQAPLIAPFRDALSDPVAFTGRGQIWSALWSYLQDHWMFGSGFGSFWSIGPKSPIHQYSDYEWVRETVYVGHNGFLDMWVTTGLPGLVLTVLVLLILPLARVFMVLSLPRGQAALIASILIFVAGNNITESSYLNGDHFLNVMLMFALAMLYVRPSQQRSSTEYLFSRVASADNFGGHFERPQTVRAPRRSPESNS